MAVYMIGYDLSKPFDEYNSLHQAIKTMKNWIRPLDSTWFVETTITEKEICNYLSPHLHHKKDKLIISLITNSISTHGLGADHIEWFDKYL